MSKLRKLPTVSNEEGTEIIQCVYCGNFKAPASKEDDFCLDCLHAASNHLDFVEGLQFAREYQEL